MAVLAVAAASLSAACRRSSGPPLPGPPQVIDLFLREYAIDWPGREIQRGQVVVRARNVGSVEHELSLVELPEDVASLQDQFRSPERRAVPTLAILQPRPPGKSGIFAVSLAPGRYALACFLPDRDGQLFAEKGVAFEFRVR